MVDDEESEGETVGRGGSGGEVGLAAKVAMLLDDCGGQTEVKTVSSTASKLDLQTHVRQARRYRAANRDKHNSQLGNTKTYSYVHCTM